MKTSKLCILGLVLLSAGCAMTPEQQASYQKFQQSLADMNKHNTNPKRQSGSSDMNPVRVRGSQVDMTPKNYNAPLNKSTNCTSIVHGSMVTTSCN